MAEGWRGREADATRNRSKRGTATCCSCASAVVHTRTSVSARAKGMHYATRHIFSLNVNRADGVLQTYSFAISVYSI